MIIKSGNGYNILIDDEDYPILSRFRWTAAKQYKTTYALTTIFILNKRTMVAMHRLITGLRKSQIDHINRNGLDNRKANLRYCTHSQNVANSKREGRFAVRGVNKLVSGKYAARVRCNNKTYHLGTFASIEEAAKTYDKKAFELWGQFAELNYPGDIYK